VNFHGLVQSAQRKHLARARLVRVCTVASVRLVPITRRTVALVSFLGMVQIADRSRVNHVTVTHVKMKVHATIITAQHLPVVVLRSTSELIVKRYSV